MKMLFAVAPDSIKEAGYYYISQLYNIHAFVSYLYSSFREAFVSRYMREKCWLFAFVSASSLLCQEYWYGSDFRPVLQLSDIFMKV